jgi:hypothetical protein
MKLWTSVQKKGEWESNINVLFEVSFTLKPNKKLATRINCFHLWSVIFQIGNFYVGHLHVYELSDAIQENKTDGGNI